MSKTSKYQLTQEIVSLHKQVAKKRKELKAIRALKAKRIKARKLLIAYVAEVDNELSMYELQT